METQLTPRQIAGAANGRLAAGAKSPEGRARSAANATKHGLTATQATTPSHANSSVAVVNESPAAFENLCVDLAKCFLPGDAHELTLVHRMAQAEWLRQRAVQMETAALSEAMRQQAQPFHDNTGSQDLSPVNAEALRAWHAFSKLSASNPAFANLQRYAAAQARAYARAERELRDYRISKAESIHPTPHPAEEPAKLHPTSAAEGRWQPLETAAPAPPMQEESPENSPDETKVTPLAPTSEPGSIDQPPYTELNSKVGSSLVSSPDPLGQNWATTVEEAACTLGQPTPYPSR